MWGRLACMGMALMLAACPPGSNTLVGALNPPSITAAPIAVVRTGATFTVSAAYTPPGGLVQTDRIQFVLNRGVGAAAFDATQGPRFNVGTIPAAAGTVSVSIPAPLIPRNSLLSGQWFVDYSLRDGGADTASVSSAVVSTRADCSAAQVNTFLAGLQTRVLAGAATTVENVPVLPQPLGIVPVISFRPNGGTVPLAYTGTHGFVSFIGQGTAFASPDLLQVGGLVPLNPAIPGLLLYTPPANLPAGRVTEPNLSDAPYTLRGFAFAARYVPGTRPVFNMPAGQRDCMPHEAWFFHEAGHHSPDGTFTGENVTEAAPGTAAGPPLPASLPPLSLPGIGGSPPWHPRLWDVHLWINTATGIPDVNICNAPGNVQGVFAPDPASCTFGLGQPIPAVGALFPANGFVQVTAPR